MSATDEAVAGPAYHRDPYLSTLDTVVTHAGVDERGAYAVLVETLLYPEGGGQPADRGTLDYLSADGHNVVFEVVDVQRVDGEVRHYIGEMPTGSGHEREDLVAVESGPCRVVMDWGRRYDHMQQHTGQHLLSALALGAYGWPTTSFHLGVDAADIELDVAAPDPSRLDALEEAVAAAIRGARPVRARYSQSPDDVPESVRARGLPAGHSGPIRIVEIEGVDACACGGTHVANTAEIESLKLLHTEPMRGGTRLHFVAGGRVRRRLGAHESTISALRGLVGVPVEELTSAVEARVAKGLELSRRLADTEGRLAQAIAAEQAAQPGPIAVTRVNAQLVAPVAQAYSRLAASPLLLVASDEASGPFALAAGLGSVADVQAAGGAVAKALGGRGGGSGQLFQGKADGLDRLREAAVAAGAWAGQDLPTPNAAEPAAPAASVAQAHPPGARS